MTSALILGYSAFDLGLFNDKDIRVDIIKTAIRRDMERLAEDGVTWLVFTGTLGFEYWALQVAKDMKADYGFNWRPFLILKPMAVIGMKQIKRN